MRLRYIVAAWLLFLAGLAGAEAWLLLMFLVGFTAGAFAFLVMMALEISSHPEQWREFK